MYASVSRPAFNFTTLICCPNCGQEGVEIWRDTTPVQATRLQSEFVKRSDEFYERASNNPRHPTEVVCRTCGMVQPENAP